MITFTNNTITLDRGDTAYIDLTIETPTGFIYDLQAGEKTEFFLRKGPSRIPTNKVIMKKLFVNRKIEFTPSDTLYQEGGKYYYDIIFTSAQGDTETIAKGEFYINL